MEDKTFALAIAGHDPCGASGILRDIKTFEKLGVYGLGVVTAITEQSVGEVRGIFPLSPERVKGQIEALINDFPVRYAKVGMVATAENARAIAAKIDEHGIIAVVDPIIRSSSGKMLIDSPESLEILLRAAYVITPNIPEAEILAGMEIKDRRDVIKAGKILEDMYGCTIIKGGHLGGEDFLFCGEMHSTRMEKLPYDARGTGCSYSSALTSFLARGYGLRDAFVNARLFVQREMERAIPIASGRVLP